MLGAAELRADGELDGRGARLGEIEARDLAPGVRLGLPECFAPAKREVGEACFLARLAARRIERLLARLDEALRKVPVAIRPEQQHAPSRAVATEHDDARGALSGGIGAGQSRVAEDVIQMVQGRGACARERIMPLTVRPDYGGGSIVNLMATLVGALGGRACEYGPLGVATLDEVRTARTVVLIVVDGLGDLWLDRLGRG